MYVLFFIMGLFTHNLINRICNLQLIEGLDGDASGSASGSDVESGFYGRPVAIVIVVIFIVSVVAYVAISISDKAGKARPRKSPEEKEISKKLEDWSGCEVTRENNEWGNHEKIYKKICDNLFTWKKNVYDQGSG
jgi:hypothetical protein